MIYRSESKVEMKEKMDAPPLDSLQLSYSHDEITIQKAPGDTDISEHSVSPIPAWLSTNMEYVERDASRADSQRDVV